MAPRETRKRTLHYKHATIIGGRTTSLAHLLDQAIHKECRPLKRAQIFGEASENVQLVNHPSLKGQMVCAAFLDFTKGAYQPTIKLDEEKMQLVIGQLPPGKREEFIESMLFFGVQRNHVILLQSNGLRSGQLERHLNWLLGDCTHVLPAGAHLALLDQPTSEARQMLGPVQKVRLRAPVAVDESSPIREETPKRVSLSAAVRQSILEVLKDSGAFLEQFSANEALTINDLELSLEIRRTGRRRDGTSLLDELARTLRNTDDEFELETRSGRVLRSGDWRLVTNKRVEVTNGIPELADVAEKMHDWLAQLIQDRQVQEVELS